ncbi:MAG: lyase family protein [Burkholderiaceae bacterium]
MQPLACAAEGIASQDSSLRLSGELRTLATSMIKICEDLRWMNPDHWPALRNQSAGDATGSSIMPGKVNPVGAEACEMACAQVIGLDAAIAAGAQRSPFQLNIMLPLIALDLLQAIELLANATDLLRTSTIETMVPVRAD